MDKPKVIVIAALAWKSGIYGINGGIPWDLPEDMKRFKELTSGNSVIMGRGTWESLPNRFRPLPNRQNIVITSGQISHPKGAVITNSLDGAIKLANKESVFFIGGERVWYPAMEFADQVFLTIVRQNVSRGKKSGAGTCRAERLLDITRNWNQLTFVGCLEKMDKKTRLRFSIQEWVRRDYPC